MALTVDKLVNKDRFNGDNYLHYLLYLPFGIVLCALRTVLALVLWVASIVLPNKSGVRQVLSTLACWTFGVYVNVKGTRDPRCSVLVANYVSCLDSLAVSHVLGTISLRKWKVPPFFASTLGIRNAAQFIRKQHFADCPGKPVLLQPEGGPTNGKGLLKFTDWPFQIGNRVQPVAISVERPLTSVTVHHSDWPSGGSGGGTRFPWRDAAWCLAGNTRWRVKVLPPLDRQEETDEQFIARIRKAIADDLQIEMTEFKWEDLNAVTRVASRAGPARGGAGTRAAGAGTSAGSAELTRLARQVKEVLPAVPLADIIRDLKTTRSVDVTITNFLEGVTRYTPETSSPPDLQPEPSTSQPRYVTPAPTGVFSKSARERQLSFQERKAQMIAEARQRYIDKHGLNALNC